MNIYTSEKSMAYVYICTHKVTNKFYIGYRCANLKHNRPSHLDFVKYRTSLSAIKDNFDEYSYVIYAEFFDPDSAYDFEQLLIYENWKDPLLLNSSCYHMKPRFRSKPLTQSHKDAVGRAHSKPKSIEHRKKLSNANLGNHWYNNGLKSVQGKICPHGFVPGRLILENEGFSSKQNPQRPGILSPNFGIKQALIQCPHCGKTGGNVLRRYHFTNCKML